ncbi:MAG: hypothetical protein OXU64_04625 [Gemmatimonadota bacterium]|nr:hypothetical protein [Gemmatimonadota bacterium]
MRPTLLTLPLALSLAVLAALPLLSGCVGEGELEPIGELLEVGPELPEGVSAGPDGSVAIGKGLAIPEGFALGEEDWKALAFMDGFDCTSIWACYVKCPWGSVCVCEWDGQRWQCVVVPSEDYCKWFKHGCGGVVGGGDWKDEVSLHCPASVTRGGTANCEIRTGNVNHNLLRVDYWRSDLGGDQYGGMTWEGVATKTAMIKVALSMEMMRESFILEQTVNVRPRDWELQEQGAELQYDSLIPGGGPGRWGKYIWGHSLNLGVGEGTGPWAGHYMVSGHPWIGLSEMYAHSDLVLGPPYYMLTATICGVLPGFRASVYALNYTCGDSATLAAFNDTIIKHENNHQESLNECVRSANSGRLAEIEELTPDPAIPG